MDKLFILSYQQNQIPVDKNTIIKKKLFAQYHGSIVPYIDVDISKMHCTKID
jgi:hypothetical protein